MMYLTPPFGGVLSSPSLTLLKPNLFFSLLFPPLGSDLTKTHSPVSVCNNGCHGSVEKIIALYQ